MFYPKSKCEKFDENLFKNPTAEYRATPFWAWNCELDKNELMRQIEVLKQMGFGGFIMHSRSGMATKYLCDEFFDYIKACTDKAEKEKMYAWIYDEDRWPSGSAGGIVTKNPKYRQRMLLFTVKTIDCDEKETAVKNGTAYHLGTYDVVLDDNGFLTSYERKDSGFIGTKWNAYCISAENSGWYNGNCYIDTLNTEAVECFIQTTHEQYKKALGDKFGKTAPAIFTDEPAFADKNTLPFAHSKDDVTIPWTIDLDETFKEKYGFDLLDKIPEIFWELPDFKPSTARYYYHDHTCQRFKEAFAETCGKWCENNGISLTGHVLGEHSLCAQTRGVGEAMRHYSSFALPGIDVLCDDLQIITAKQAQSAARQQGAEGIMSELYGVTNWDFDFKHHKAQGDWQAAMGITARVPHLSWVSMKGSAKRDFPASINYQSPWYSEYSVIEDHFARLATVLTRGTPCVDIGVIHPMDSYWMHYGPADMTADVRNQAEYNFEELIKWFLSYTIDFDFINEAELPKQCKVSDKFSVGKMNYKVIIVPNCETLRSTTVAMLDEFINNGGEVIFAGSCPKYIDCKEDNRIKELYDRGVAIPFERTALNNAISKYRTVEIKTDSGETPPHFVYQMRRDGDCKWCFIANAKTYEVDLQAQQNDDGLANDDIKPTNTIIKIKGEYTPTVYNTESGKTEEISYTVKDGNTVINRAFFECDSLLLKLSACTADKFEKPEKQQKTIAEIDYKCKVKLNREEDNVCLLDLAQYSADGTEYYPTEEILRIDKKLRDMLGWSNASGGDVQPWAIEPEKITKYILLKFTVYSEYEAKDLCFCAEELESLSVNGNDIPLIKNGYYVDTSIIKYSGVNLSIGENTIIAKVPFGKRTSIEQFYLTGDFDVDADGCTVTIKPPRKTIAFGNITHQGMPFYSGNLSYETQFEAPCHCDILVNTARFAGSLVKIYIDGCDKGAIFVPPYNLKVKDIKKGTHNIVFKLFGNRYNTFGALHNCGNSRWYGSEHWYSTGDSWCYEYNFKNYGILKSPVIKILD